MSNSSLFPNQRYARFALWSSATFFTLCCLARLAAADPPPGYYDSVDTTNAATLRATLHAVIDDHTRFPYTSTATDTWDILDLADEDPGDPGNILDVYRNASYPKAGAGNSFYNREHSWPNSYGYPNDNASNYPYTDCHALFLSDDGYNSSRGRRPYRFCHAACDELPTDVNNGQGGGTGVYPGNSNWGEGPQNDVTGTWETWIGRRGDVARALLYLDVRYEGGTHGVTGAAEPDLILTDSEALIDASNTGQNESVAYMGMITALLSWHVQDPVDDVERNRNDVVFGFQGNRNPFVDHPEWVDCVFNGINCGGDTTPPAAPTNLAATAGDAVVNLDWSDNAEPDLAGYNVYRSTTSGGPYGQINGSLVTASAFSDTGVTNGTTYFYVVTAEDTSANESASSNEASATPTGGGPTGNPWINEFHYDNSGGDTGEFVEIAGPAGTNLSGWSVVGYNGSGGGAYKTVNLSGAIPDQGGCMGTISFAFSNMQNDMDGLALVAPGPVVIEFISYEGSFTATDGPANGMTSTNIGVDEDPAPAAGNSLQLSGTGSQATDFTWQAPANDTPGQPNNGQTFNGCGGITDCNGNGVDDAEDIATGTSQDCNGNAVPDECDIASGTSQDTNGNGVPDECEGAPTTMHVDSIVLGTVAAGQGKKRGQATVTILDNQGNPVSNAQVTGSFTGDFNETQAATTNGSGVAVLTTNGSKKGSVSFSFCVDNVTHATLSYDSGANVETCDSF